MSAFRKKNCAVFVLSFILDGPRYSNQFSYSCVYQNLSTASEMRMTSPGISVPINCENISSDDVRVVENLSEAYQRNIYDQNEDISFEQRHNMLLHPNQEGNDHAERLGLVSQEVISSVTDLCIRQNSYLS